MKFLKKIILNIFVKIFIYLNKYFRLKPKIFSDIISSIGIGVMSNVIFVLTTNQKVDAVYLVFSFICAIIFIVVGSIEKKD